MARRRTTTASVDIETPVVEEEQTTPIVAEETESPNLGSSELETRLAELEAKYEKLVSALRMNGQVSAALNKFYD